MRWNKRNFGILKVCRGKEHGRKKEGNQNGKITENDN